MSLVGLNTLQHCLRVRSIKTSLRTLLLVIAILLFPGGVTYSVSEIDFFYYFPDSVQSNFSLLKQEVDSFLNKAKFGGQFQAFSHEVDFDRLVRERKPGMVLVPAWYYDRYGKSLALKPILTSLRKGRPGYTKILLARKSKPFPSLRLDAMTVAVTNMGPDTAQQLNHYFSKCDGVDFSKSNVIITPKDADAFYALVLGQVDAAVVSRETIQAVGQTNPRLVQLVQERAASKPIPMPIICVTDGVMSTKRIDRLKQLLLQSGEQAQLPSFMRMLYISGWKNGLL